MAAAFARLRDVQPTVDTAGSAALTLSFDTYIAGSEIAGGYTLLGVDVPVSFGDAPGAIQRKITSAVQAACSAYGYTLANADLTIPAYNKGL